MKKFKIEYLLLLALFSYPFFLILPVVNNKIENQDRNEQISHVADVTEETTFTTTNQEELNQLIQEIQKNGKQIIKIDIEDGAISKMPTTIKITYK